MASNHVPFRCVAAACAALLFMLADLSLGAQVGLQIRIRSIAKIRILNRILAIHFTQSSNV